MLSFLLLIAHSHDNPRHIHQPVFLLLPKRVGIIIVTTHVVRLKGSEKHYCSTLAECDSCIKHGFKIRFFLIIFSLQAIHLSSY